MDETKIDNVKIEKQPNIEEQPPTYNETPTKGDEVRLSVWTRCRMWYRELWFSLTIVKASSRRKIFIE